MVTRDGEIYTFETPIAEGVNMFHYFNYALYRKYREAKKENPNFIKDTKIKDHPLIGTAFLRDDGVIGIIEIVSRHWWFGYYEHMVYRMHNTKSHGTGVIKNISCIFDSIIESAEEFKRYKILDKSEVPPETINLDI